MDWVTTMNMEKETNNTEFGQKYVRLLKLQAEGYPVPSCVGVGKTPVSRLLKAGITEADYEDVAGDARRKIGAKMYAVRSSAFVEDGTSYSHAGEFKTLLRVLPSNLKNAIQDIINDAVEKGHATLENPFSLIIQEYVDPKIAGVIFTRNPNGGNEMVVEWKEGDGAEVVGGGYSMHRTFPFGNLPKNLPFTRFDELVATARKIEEEADFPQDIEWAITEDKLYILQARPITSIQENQFRALQHIDNMHLKGEYYYDRSALIESFDQVLPLGLEILRYLHSENKAISRVYESLGIQYTNKDIFRPVGNTLYIDKEEEIKQFFPTHSYFGTSFPNPHFARVSGILRTLANMYHFQVLSFRDITSLRALLETHALNVKADSENNTSFRERLISLDNAYADVFLINVLSEKAYKDLASVLQGSQYSPLQIISSGIIDFQIKSNERLLSIIGKDILGNSLNIADQSIFIAKAGNQNSTGPSTDIITWWKSLPQGRRVLLEKKIIRAREYEMLREEGRWITALYMSGLRDVLQNRGERSGLKDWKLLYYATIDEIENGTFDREELGKRKVTYDVMKEYSFPRVISSLLVNTPKNSFGVSPGEASGYLARPGKDIKKGAILITETLDPALTAYFDRIGGIVSRQGGVLSHLAIVAREHGIPVVVDQRVNPLLVPGHHVRINGNKGTVERI